MAIKEYQMTRYIGDTTRSMIDRLTDKITINQNTDCWEWQAGKNNLGYGLIRDDKKMRLAHRVSYEEHIGSIPYNMCVCHTCDNPKCINPKHLWLGTRKQNAQDMMKKGRHRLFGWVPGTPGVRTGAKFHKLYCIHCNRDIAANTYARFHGDKCKLKP